MSAATVTPVVVSLISAAVAITSVLLSARTARRTAQLSYELDREKSRATKEEQVEEVMSRYREPLLRAAFDLQSRIYNIIVHRFMVRYGAEGREHEREYARTNTVFLFAEYFGWVEILRRDVQFLDLGDVERNHLLVERLESIGDTFSSSGGTLSDPAFRMLRGQQRALGELMIPSAADGGGRRYCIGYAHFCARLRDEPAFAEWFRSLCEDISVLSDERTACGYERLTKLQHALIDLIDFLDDPPARFRAEFRRRL